MYPIWDKLQTVNSRRAFKEIINIWIIKRNTHHLIHGRKETNSLTFTSLELYRELITS